MCDTQKNDKTYIKIIENIENGNSIDLTLEINLEEIPINFANSLYDQLQIPMTIEKFYVTVKIIGQVLVTETTYYVLESGICVLERNKEFIRFLLDKVYGHNKILF